MMNKKTILISLITLLGISGVFATCDYYIDSCQDLNVPDSVYCLNTSLTDQAIDCFTISNNNITLDCQNYLIDGTYSSTYKTGVLVNIGYNNITIRNCEFNDFMRDIWLKGNENVSIYNNNFSNSYQGVRVSYSTYGGLHEIYNNTDSGTGTYSLEFESDTYNISVYDNNFVKTFLSRASYVNVYNNNFSIINSWSSGNGNYYNNKISNYWLETGGNYLINNFINQLQIGNNPSSKVENGSVNIYDIKGGMNEYITNTNMTNYSRNITFEGYYFPYKENGVMFNSTWDYWSGSPTYIRLLQNINKSYIKWNDTPPIDGVNATYDLSGLKTNAIYKIYDNGVLKGKNTTDNNGILPMFSIYLGSEHEIIVNECIPNWTLSSNITSCYNSTTRLVNETYTDTSGCNESNEYLTFINVPNETFYECVGDGVFNYIGSCGDGTCYLLEGEDQDNCCLDCGCPIFYRCTDNVCQEKVIEKTITETGWGIGNFLDSIREPLVNFVLILSIIGGVLLIVYVIFGKFGESIEGSSSRRKGG